jgi:hypothetical protein
MFSGAPRRFVILIAVVLGLRLLFALAEPGSFVFSLVKMTLLLVFAWQALLGKESAAKGLAVLLLLGAALDGFGLIRFAMAGQPWALLFMVFPIFHIGVAAYIFRSKALEEFFSAKAYA